MFRPRKGLPEEVTSAQTYPHPAPANVDRYWLWGGWTRKEDTLEDIDIEALQLSDVIEANRPWEQLKLPIICSVCKEEKEDLPLLERVHWNFLHCVQCPDYFACEDCAGTVAFIIDRVGVHMGHDFVRIRSRPREAPLHDGSDLEQLQLFKAADCADDFFVYFPWFFHCFRGMEELRDYFKDVFIADITTKVESGELQVTEEQLDGILMLFNFPVDWFMRSYGGGNWRVLHEGLSTLTNSRIQTAAISQPITQLLGILRQYVDRKFELFGTGDITVPFMEQIREQLIEATEEASTDYDFYMILLHVLTVLNDKVKMRELKAAIYTEVGDNMQLVSANNAGLKGGASHLSNPVLPETKRLWPMFKLLFEDHPAFSALQGCEEINDLALYFEYRSPKWNKFILRDHSIRALLFELQYQNLPTTVNYLLEMKPLPSSSQSTLKVFRAMRTFDEALGGLSTLDVTDPKVVVELQLLFLQQGSFEKVKKCAEIMRPSTQEDLTSCTHAHWKALAFITMKYAEIFTEGKWEEALEQAKRLLNLLNVDSVNYQSPAHALIYTRIELVVHRIIMETYRDLGKAFPRDATLFRLTAIRKCLAECEPCPIVAEVLWDVLDTELEIRKRLVRAQYLEFEASFSMYDYLHAPEEVLPIVEEILKSKVLQGDNDISIVLRGRIEMLLADLRKLAGGSAAAIAHTENARRLFELVKCEYGLLDVETFEALGKGVPSYAEIKALYDRYRERNDIARLRTLRKVRFRMTDVGTPEGNWLLYQRAEFKALAAEAGDNLAFHRWSLRKYAGDFLVGAAVQPAESVISGEAIHSTRLTTLATFNLCMAYNTVGNHFEAALNGMFHLSLTIAQNDAENHQKAILNVLQVFADFVASNVDTMASKLPKMGTLWNGWLEDQTIKRWANGEPRCDEMDRFIDGACFLPLLAGRVGWQGIVDHARFSQFERVLVAHMAVALGIYMALPDYLSSAVLPKIALALGAVAAFGNNYELSIRCYQEGLRVAHSGDRFKISSLRLEAGKMMVALGNRDPEHWLHIVAFGRSLLKHAATGFVGQGRRSGAVWKVAEVNLHLFKSYVTEARARKKHFGQDLTNAGGVVADMDDFVGQFNGISKVVRAANDPLFTNEGIFDFIANRLSISATHEYHKNLALLAENSMLLEMKQLTIELCLISSVSAALMDDAQEAEGLWNMIQRYKGGVLGYSFGRVVPPDLMDRIQANPTAWELYRHENTLIEEGPQNPTDMRLISHQSKMEDSAPELEELIRRRKRRGVTKTEVADFVKKALPQVKGSVILFDWIRYEEYFILVGYNPQTGKFTEPHVITECSNAQVKQWVKDHLLVPEVELVDVLGTSNCLGALRPLIEPISHFAVPGATLVFSPAQLLNALPLHAIPYRAGEDTPIIEFHPIIYSPSNTILKECIERSLAAPIQTPLTAKLFCRYPEDQQAADTMISDLQQVLEARDISTSSVTGSGVTHSKITEEITKADILHFHGHVSGDRLQRYLVLEQDTVALPEGNTRRSAYPNAHPAALRMLSSALSAEAQKTQTLAFQDVTSANIRARLVLLMGCGSGVQEITKADDALGLLNSFLAAGATTVMATLWPLDNDDAEIWSKAFYKAVFGGDAVSLQEGMVDLAFAMQIAVREARACRRPRCSKRTLQQRLKCHKVSPYRWAPFVGWGSWISRLG